MSNFNEFVTAFPSQSKAINALKSDGVGPGEMLAYFIFDNIGVGGKNASIDLMIDGSPFAEVKGGNASSGSKIDDFKLSKDGDPAVTGLLKDLSKFNDKHAEITGELLPGWDNVSEIPATKLRSWRDIDLEELAKNSTGGSKTDISLILKKNGDLLRKGETDPIMNVKTGKSTAPIKKLIDGSTKAAVDASISTIDKIEERWAEAIIKGYAKDKNFALLDSKTLKLVFFGRLKKNMLGILRTTRGQPKVVVNLAPSKSKGKKEAEE
jgi:hypothetical protein